MLGWDGGVVGFRRPLVALSHQWDSVLQIENRKR